MTTASRWYWPSAEEERFDSANGWFAKGSIPPVVSRVVNAQADALLGSTQSGSKQEARPHAGDQHRSLLSTNKERQQMSPEMALHWKLRWIRLKIRLGMRYNYGICGALGNCAYIMHLFPMWKKWSGCFSYPVPDPLWKNKTYAHRMTISTKQAAANIYKQSSYKAKWDKNHPYGKLRRELLDFLIEQTK